ncbi:hypothetical protein [Candidatus Avelusimicrobium fimicolum]|uniref:hypothetical protein n=1 Tax=Candidatus Avelusimicrobium fimicolum TaxID=3416216 RepID=UPI003D0F0CC4
MEKKHIDNDGFPNAPRRTLAGRYFAEMTSGESALGCHPQGFGGPQGSGICCYE